MWAEGPGQKGAAEGTLRHSGTAGFPGKAPPGQVGRCFPPVTAALAVSWLHLRVELIYGRIEDSALPRIWVSRCSNYQREDGIGNRQEAKPPRAEGQAVAMMTLKEGWCGSPWEEAGRGGGAWPLQRPAGPAAHCAAARGTGDAEFHSCIFCSVCCRLLSDQV